MLIPIDPSINVPDAEALLAKLRIQLTYDDLTQANFIKIIINSYLQRDQRIISILTENNYKSYKKFKQKDLELTNKTIRDFNLEDKEIDDIFDIIARENPEL